jgi:YebC/PmpR family DNA-binding regulatory protein
MTIKHKKQSSDAKKGKEFSKVSKLLMSATREGGADPANNLKLQYAMDRAREVNMPKDNVERAIKKGLGGTEGLQLETVFYEGFGPAGIALMVEAITDNRNRAVSEIRKIFDTRGGRLGEVNSVRRLFVHKGFFNIPAGSLKEDEVLNIALEAGADDAELVGNVFEITCDPKDFATVKKFLKAKGLELTSSEITYVPKEYVPISHKNEGRKILDLMENLEDHDDVQNVYANFDIPEEIIAEVAADKAAKD